MGPKQSCRRISAQSSIHILQRTCALQTGQTQILYKSKKANEKLLANKRASNKFTLMVT